jgi:hypothetical protein
MCTFQCSAASNTGRLRALRARLHSTIGGVSDTELKLLAVMPTGEPSPARAVTIVTPVANMPSAWRKSLGSNAVGCCIVDAPSISPRTLPQRLAAESLSRTSALSIGPGGLARRAAPHAGPGQKALVRSDDCAAGPRWNDATPTLRRIQCMIAAPDARAIARMMMIETDYLTPEAAELVDVARSLVPKLAARAAGVDANGIVHPDSVREIHDAGLFRVLQPKRWGGHEMDPRVFYTIQMILAEGCMSTAWIYGVIGVHYWQLPLFTEAAQNDVWGKDASTRIASTYMPVGKAEKVDGGYRFSGRWGFSSGCEYAEWIFLGGLLPKADGSGALEHCTFLLPKSDYKIVKNWDVLGLRAYRQPRHRGRQAPSCRSTAPTAPTTTATPPAPAAPATRAGCIGSPSRRCSSARYPAPASARSTARSREFRKRSPRTWASTAPRPPRT